MIRSAYRALLRGPKVGEGVGDVLPALKSLMRVDGVCARHSLDRVKLLKIAVEV
jgi:hypothetical protein